MEYNLQVSFRQFDRQTNDRVFSHIELSNLYLAVERGDVELTRDVGNDLWSLMRKTYPPTETIMLDYWNREFDKLPGWDQW